jgi:hypothetical protein
MIDSEDVAGTCMYRIKSLGTSLHAFCNAEGDDIELVMWKSNIQMVLPEFMALA